MLVVQGLRRARKTQVVFNYVWRHLNKYKVMFWIEAGRKELIKRDFMNIYQLLFNVCILASQEVIKADNAILGVKNWFSERRDQQLLIFNSVNNINNKKDSDYIDLKHFMLDALLIYIIVTT